MDPKIVNQIVKNSIKVSDAVRRGAGNYMNISPDFAKVFDDLHRDRLKQKRAKRLRIIDED